MTDTPTPATIDVEWNGETFTVPANPDQWPYKAVGALEEGKGVAFLRYVLAPAQMRLFDRHDPTAKDASDLMGAILDAAGAKSAGESSAS